VEDGTGLWVGAVFGLAVGEALGETLGLVLGLVEGRHSLRGLGSLRMFL